MIYSVNDKTDRFLAMWRPEQRLDLAAGQKRMARAPMKPYILAIYDISTPSICIGLVCLDTNGAEKTAGDGLRGCGVIGTRAQTAHPETLDTMLPLAGLQHSLRCDRTPNRLPHLFLWISVSGRQHNCSLHAE